MEVYMINEKEHIQLKNNIKRERFLRIAESRVNKILTNLDNLGKCANPRNYDFSEASLSIVLVVAVIISMISFGIIYNRKFSR